MIEEWRKVKNCEDYSVSNFGRVRRDTPSKGQGGIVKAGMILRLDTGKWGHQRIRLYSNGEYTRFLVHRLVAITFQLPRREDQVQVAHNDGNPLNNHVSNLRWATVKENHADKLIHGTSQRGEKSGMNKGITEDIVREIRAMRSIGLPYAEITKRFGVNKVTACAIVKRRNWAHVA